MFEKGTFYCNISHLNTFKVLAFVLSKRFQKPKKTL